MYVNRTDVFGSVDRFSSFSNVKKDYIKVVVSYIHTRARERSNAQNPRDQDGGTAD